VLAADVDERVALSPVPRDDVARPRASRDTGATVAARRQDRAGASQHSPSSSPGLPREGPAGSRGRKLLGPSARKEVVLGVGLEPDRDTRGDDQLALAEIRRLFDRYRQIGRHGMVTERDEIEEVEKIEEANEPTARAVR
jgi:hypothetical protein